MSCPRWVVGAGPTGTEYGKCLKHMDLPFQIIGRREGSASFCERVLGERVIRGGVERALHFGAPREAIVAVPVDQLAPVVSILLDAGVRRVLVEKPGGINAAEIEALSLKAEATGAEIFVAFNRRFYASTQKVRKLIQADGGVSSFHFDFTELGFRICTQNIPSKIKESWLFANSSHVIDLAFFLGGLPQQLISFKDGELSWHPRGARYAGAGRTSSGALFSYHANWDAPGRWGLELRTKLNRYLLQPLEGLMCQKLGTFDFESVDLDLSFERGLKPGLLLQTEAFVLGKEQQDLLTIRAHHSFCRNVLESIENGRL